MMHAPLTRAFATLLIIVLVAPSALLVAPAPVYAALTSVHKVSSSDPSDLGTWAETTITAVKEAASYLLKVTSTAAEYALYIKTYILDPIAFIMGGNLLKSITSSILNFVNKNKLYVQNLPGYLQNVGDVQAYAFLNQFSSTSNSPFASTITSSLRANYLQQTSMAGFFAANRNTLSKSSPNYKSFLAGNWSQGGASAWFALTTQDQNNPYMLYYRAQDQMTRSVQNMTAAKLAQLNWGQGFLSWCGSGVNTTSSSGADASGAYGDTQESIISCTGTTEIMGDGCGCDAKTNPDGCVDDNGKSIDAGTYVLPDNWTCPTDSTWDSSYGGCSFSTLGGGTDIIPPNDENGNPAVTIANGDEVGDTPSTTVTAGDGTTKFSTGTFDLTATTNLTKLDAILTDASKVLPEGYTVVVTSAERNKGNSSAHETGDAVDIQIFDANGVKLPNSGDASATGYYKDFAVAAYDAQQTLYPISCTNASSQVLRWGGCFDTSAGSGKKDGMHFDLDGCNRPQGRYCSSGLSGVAAGGTVSLGPQSALVASAATPAPAKKKSSSVVGNALGYVWNLAPAATAAYGDDPAADVAADVAEDPTGTGGTSSSVVKIPQPGDSCTKKDGTQGRIQTPGSVIKGFLTDVLGLNVKKATMIGDIGASINGILSNVTTILKTVDMAAGLFGAAGGLGSVGGTSSYDSPFNTYLESSSYMGLKTTDIKDTGKVVNNLDSAAAVNAANPSTTDTMTEILPGSGAYVNPGDTISYRINIAPISGAQTNFTITDTIPTYTTLSIQGGGTDTNSASIAGATGQIWWKEDAPADGWSGYVTFSVTVDTDAPASSKICNTAQFVSDQVASKDTNEVCNTVYPSTP
ncbi:MAG: hypothetical protein Q7S95_00645 [bacterium]|nr:hypothetical protein [bacterium]